MVDVAVDEWVMQSSRRQKIRRQLLPKGVNVKCWICGQDGADQLDHKLPRSKHPELVWDLANIVPAHADCNNAKSDTVDPPGIGVPSEAW